MENKVFVLNIIIWSLLAVVFQIIGVALPYWIYIDEQGIEGNAGLWTLCLNHPKLRTCSVYKSLYTNQDFVMATGAMELIALFFMVGEICILLWKKFVMNEKEILVIGGAVAAFAAGAFALIGIIVYGAKFHLLFQKFDPIIVKISVGASFIFCTLSAFLSFVNGFILIMTQKQGTIERSENKVLEIVEA